jgi:hypothetical protein
MKVRLNAWQQEVASDNHRFRIVCAGRRAGKSVLARLITLKWSLEKVGMLWIVSPTYRQGKQNHWRELRKEIPRDWIAKTNDTELSIQLKNGSLIELKGAENPDALRGVKLRGLVIDEIASIRNWDWLWNEVLRATLTDYEAPALFISTPKGFNHFFELYEEGQKAESSYKSWRFTSYDNPFIPKEEIDNAKKELTEDTFAQEYLADFRKFTGLAHKGWNRETNIIPYFDVPKEWQRGRGFDYGTAHFTASPRIAIDNDDNWFVENSYLDNQRNVQGHAEAIKALDYGLGFIICFGDPSGAQWFMEFEKYDLHIQPANKEVGQNARGWVEYGVEKINERLKPIPGHTIILPNGVKIENAPRFFVLDTSDNQNFIKQIENLKWRETATGDIVPVLDETGDPTGGHFDLMAAMRYFAASYQKTVKNISNLPQFAEPIDGELGL